MGYPVTRYQVIDSASAEYDTGRSLSAALWQETREQFGQPHLGVFHYDDFTVQRANTTDASADEGWFIEDAAAGGTNENFTSSTSPDGEATLSASTGTDHFGIEAHWGDTATTLGRIALPQHSTLGRGKVTFEARVDVDASDNWFVGLSEPIVEFLSSTGTLPEDSDYIGFYRADDGDLTFVYHEGASGAVTSHTIEAAADLVTGYNKLGFSVDKDNEVVITVNGKPILANTSGTKIAITSAELPNESLTYKLATTRGATGDLATVTILVDWVASFIAAA